MQESRPIRLENLLTLEFTHISHIFKMASQDNMLSAVERCRRNRSQWNNQQLLVSTPSPLQEITTEGCSNKPLFSPQEETFDEKAEQIFIVSSMHNLNCLRQNADQEQEQTDIFFPVIFFEQCHLLSIIKRRIFFFRSKSLFTAAIFTWFANFVPRNGNWNLRSCFLHSAKNFRRSHKNWGM